MTIRRPVAPEFSVSFAKRKGFGAYALQNAMQFAKSPMGESGDFRAPEGRSADLHQKVSRVCMNRHIQKDRFVSSGVFLERKGMLTALWHGSCLLEG
ncbi:hypothetical protein LAZ40_19560 [Cereibacter sphaeroides]|uniref:hypothetical protein n=1 Tax=Cereibacter sphaeroides TaxID=1063 RepID=UPI001F1A64DA|nr:hypothetical protein [Cereibacter sphaeroides]MCE6961229.1 hypothetical protein [Cereibacter sphaeroides]MCE6970215.1 hypothetical protein [Cereibacter sphaeroides]MCE6974046.1 hypothetical protein [Cereibacter sphaeroides]